MDEVDKKEKGGKLSTVDGLALEGITKRYNKFTLNSVSGHLKPREIVALVGRNGAGKTTLLKTILGLLKPDDGRVLLDGNLIVNSGTFDGFAAKLHLGYLPEDPVFYDHLRLGRLLRFCAAPYPCWDQKFAVQLLQRFELDEAKPVGDLSRGMRVKLGLLIALSHRPKALLLDEPLSGLDPISRVTIMTEIRSLVDTANCCCIVSSHDLEDVKKISNSIWALRSGTISIKLEKQPSGAWQSGGREVHAVFDEVVTYI